MGYSKIGMFRRLESGPCSCKVRWAMADISTPATAPLADELERMHALYRRGGQERQMAPHIVYQDAALSSRRLRAADAGDRLPP